jgi:endonuclease/exonuclease/phosphatase family metal-dependent hydrolase
VIGVARGRRARFATLADIGQVRKFSGWRRRHRSPMLGLMSMRLAVVALALAGCSFGLQPVPKHVAVEATFPSRPPVAELPAQFKVATFNVHKEPGDKIAKALLADRELRDADLLMLQEVPRWDEACSGACAIGNQLGMYALFAPGHVEGDKDMGVAILSKAPITSAQIIELPWHDVHFNAGRRIALVATLEQAGRPITVYAVHLENRLTASERKRQMLPILEHARRQHTPVIIAGDFNTNPFTWISHWLPLPTGRHQARQLEALVRAYGFDTPVADSGATHRYIGMKLDAIYTRGFATRRFATAHAQDVSDHLALWATLRPEPVLHAAR